MGHEVSKVQRESGNLEGVKQNERKDGTSQKIGQAEIYEPDRRTDRKRTGQRKSGIS